jgi:hypothetical protein
LPISRGSDSIRDSDGAHRGQLQEPTKSGQRSYGPAVAALLGVTVLALYVARYPPAWPAAPDLTWPDSGKIASAARSLLALLVVNLAALGAGLPLVALCRVESPGLGRVLRITVGLFSLAHLVLALGLLGWLSPSALGVVTLATALVGAGALLRTARRRIAATGWLPGVGGPAAWLIVPSLALSALWAFVPRYGWDALTYHLALPERFLRMGHLVFDPYSHFTTFPLLTEMLYTLALALDGPTLAKLLYVEFGALLVAALASMGRRFGTVAALFASACLLADPLFLWETTVVYSDLGLALLALLAADAILSWDARPSAATAARAALLGGLCAAVRYPGALVSVALALALLAGGRQSWRRRLGMGAALGVGATCLLAPWLLRNVAHTGTLLGLNAFDPIFLEQMVAFNRGIGMGHGLLALIEAPWNVTFRTVPGLYSHSFGYQVGPLYFLAGILAVATAWRSVEGAFLVRAAALQLLAWFFTAQESRYLLPAFALLALAAAPEAERLAAAAAPRLRATLAMTPAGALLLGQLWFWNGSGSLYRMALGNIPWTSVTQATPVEVVGTRLRALRRPGIKVLCLFESRTWQLRGMDSISYHLNEGSPVLLAVHRALASRGLCRWLSEEGVTHLVVNTRAAEPPTFVDGYSRSDWSRDLDLLNRFLASSADLRDDVGGTLLFELRPRDECRDPEPGVPAAP